MIMALLITGCALAILAMIATAAGERHDDDDPTDSAGA